jgi:thioredoxin-dependent peroxiredoxin
MVDVGKKAPDFCLPSAAKDKVCLTDHKGRWTVIFFYAKDNTSG